MRGTLYTEDLNIRRSTRVLVSLKGLFRERGAPGTSIEILDLSLEGFRGRWERQMEPGRPIWLKLPGLESLSARVVWWQDFMIGGAFDSPLHPAILDRLTRDGSLGSRLHSKG